MFSAWICLVQGPQEVSKAISLDSRDSVLSSQWLPKVTRVVALLALLIAFFVRSLHREANICGIFRIRIQWRHVNTIFWAIFYGDIPWNLGLKHRHYFSGTYLQSIRSCKAWPLTLYHHSFVTIYIISINSPNIILYIIIAQIHLWE